MPKLTDILFFLCCGYLPKYSSSELPSILREFNLSQLGRNIKEEIHDKSILIKNGIRALKSAFINIDEDVHIVPLSGGLDSRAILAGLIAAGQKDKIITATFGVPGTYDYEIGISLAQELGLPNKSFNLNTIKVEQDDLLETARNGSAWTPVFEAYYNSLICKEFGRDVTYWIGHMGDVLAGSHLPLQESVSWNKAIEYFLKWNKLDFSDKICKSNYNPHKSLPALPILNRFQLSYDDQLDFIIRQQNFTKRIIMFRGYKYKVPFLAPDWVKFMLSLPQQYRLNMHIYKEILFTEYPRIFSFPTKNNYGASLSISGNFLIRRKILNKIRKMTTKYKFVNNHIFDSIWNNHRIYKNINYIDFDDALRNRKELKSLVFDNIQDLKDRKILNWIRFDELWNLHQEKRINLGNAFILLTDLEISLKSDDLKSYSTK
jgi:hypothetical protein